MASLLPVALKDLLQHCHDDPMADAEKPIVDPGDLPVEIEIRPLEDNQGKEVGISLKLFLLMIVQKY